MQLRRHASGFSLVELAIVLVILGLLVGGILAGRALIRASELRSIGTDLNRYKTAVMAFKDKYFALPGDMPNATAFWGAADGNDGLGLDCYETDSTGLQTTCNGDGNTGIQYSSINYGNEKFRSWQHLANAGLIEGTYSGQASVTTGASTRSVGADPSPRLPASKLAGAWYDMHWVGNCGSSSSWCWEGSYRNTIYVGTPDSAGDLLEKGVMTGADMWNIDTKIDDGVPATGRIRTYKGRPLCNLSSSNGAEYNLSSTSTIDCHIIYITGY